MVVLHKLEFHLVVVLHRLELHLVVQSGHILHNLLGENRHILDSEEVPDHSHPAVVMEHLHIQLADSVEVEHLHMQLAASVEAELLHIRLVVSVGILHTLFVVSVEVVPHHIQQAVLHSHPAGEAYMPVVVVVVVVHILPVGPTMIPVICRVNHWGLYRNILPMGNKNNQCFCWVLKISDNFAKFYQTLYDV